MVKEDGRICISINYPSMFSKPPKELRKPKYKSKMVKTLEHTHTATELRKGLCDCDLLHQATRALCTEFRGYAETLTEGDI